MTIYWAIFVLLIFVFIALDLFVFYPKPKVIQMSEVLFFSAFWIGLALAFTGVIYWIYADSHLSDPQSPYFKSGGGQAALQYFTGYFLEKSLSLDNLFVIYLIFSYFRIPPAFQRRVLTIGILSAALFRAILIFFGLALVSMFHWIFYLFGVVLLFAGIQLIARKKQLKAKDGFSIKFAKLFFKTTPDLKRERFFIKKKGVWMMTPLFLALLQVESADLIFAFDSIPAIFAITTDPFIVFTSNMFAIFGLRSLYFTLAPALQKFRYLHISLALMIIYIGIKMLLHEMVSIPNYISLLILLFLLTGGIFLSLLFPKKARTETEFPLQNEIIQAYSFTVKQARRIAILVIGTSILLVGIAFIFIPGPAFLVIPLGVLILSTEFLFVKKWFKKVKDLAGKK